MLTALHSTDGQFGQPSYPDFVTHFNEVVVDPTRLELDGVAVRDTDSDGDGLPDDWETFYFTNLVQTGAADADTDGASNLAEYRAGTDPAQASSVLRFHSVVREAGGRTTLRLSHAASRSYAIEFTDDFSAWTPQISAPVYLLGTNVAEWTDHSPAAGKRFYRLRAD